MNAVAGAILYPYMTSSIRDAIKRNTAGDNNISNAFSEHPYTMVFGCAEFEGENVGCPRDDVCMKRLFVSLLHIIYPF